MGVYLAIFILVLGFLLGLSNSRISSRAIGSIIVFSVAGVAIFFCKFLESRFSIFRSKRFLNGLAALIFIAVVIVVVALWLSF